MSTSTKTKPSIVFCHGIWADGSCFSKVIPPLQAEGYEVMAAECPGRFRDVRCCPSSLYTFPTETLIVPAGLGSGSPCYRVPRI